MKAVLWLWLSVCLASAQEEATILLLARGRASPTPPSSLVTNLVAYWRLDELSGSRADVKGTNTLSDTGAVGYRAGMITNTAVFTDAGNKSLNAIDSPELSITTNDEFTVAGWAFLDNTNVARGVVIKGPGPGVANAEWWIWYRNATAKLRFGISSGAAFASLDNSIITVSNNWYFFAGWWTGNKLYFRVNNTVTTTAWANGATNGQNAVSFGQAFLDGAIDEVGFWKGRALSTNELDTLYNSGAGRTYPFQ